MTKTASIAFLLVTASVAACAPEGREDQAAEELMEAAEPQNLEHVGDVAPAAREAVSDTQAAIDEATGEIGEAYPAN